MSFYADLHIHSKFSRATSRDCDLEHLSLWARKKGIAVLGTGDFTHAGWLTEIREKLEPAEPGLLRLRADIERAVAEEAGNCAGLPTRFMLSVEISTIYKKTERTRKSHHVILAPSLEHVERMTKSLSRIGNLAADGRPILGLDARDLLEIVLESGEGAFLIPAHIWTPWFSALGSKSGFDSIEECYGDLAGHIFAVETGLSSDPPMNWRLSALDRYRLVSNSDAHSPGKLGREACVFDCETDYFAMRRALETGERYGGTIEFFPEEGKYHLDGHRKCGVCLTPSETRDHAGLCPICGKALTVGVMSRVEELADRPEGERPQGAAPFRNLIPLAEVLSELEGVGQASKRVVALHEKLLAQVGPELFILEHAGLDEIRRHGSEPLAEAIRRMRAGAVIREAGYDGEYGVIHLFEPSELEGDASPFLFSDVEMTPEVPQQPLERPAATQSESRNNTAEDCERTKPRLDLRPSNALAAEPCASYARTNPILDALDIDQRAAAETLEGPLLIIAGPGTGKTRTLTHRLAHLVTDHGVEPESCLAITFTRRAAGEMRERLQRLSPDVAGRIPVQTFHSLGLSLVREHAQRFDLPPTFRVADDEERRALLGAVAGCSAREAGRLLERMSKRDGTSDDEELRRTADAYRAALRARGWIDFDDLIALPVTWLETDAALRDSYRNRFKWVCVDEYQDIDAPQYRLIRLLAPPDGNLCAIGDPDQSIYSFRGSDVAFFKRFEEDYPGARIVRLTRSYRCGRTILQASGQVIAEADHIERRLNALLDHPERIMIHAAPTERAEAEFVVQCLEEMLGGHTFFSLDSGRSGGHATGDFTFSDFAVLYRLDAQADALGEALARSGIPYQKRSHHRLNERPSVRQLVDAMQAGRTNGSVVEALRNAARRLLDAAKDDSLPGLVEKHERADKQPMEPQIAAAVALLEPLATQHSDDWTRFLDAYALGEEVDLWDPRAEAVSLMTLHAAKGLEFPVVFVVGCEDGLLPLRWGSHIEPQAFEEERRLFYVGMTRAQQRLVLCHAKNRLRHGKVAKPAPSPFLLAIAERLVERRASAARRRETPKADPQMELFVT